MPSDDPPDPRDPTKDYKRGIEIYLDKLDDLLAAEHGARDIYDPARIEQQQEWEDRYGPRRTVEMRERLRELDPEGERIRGSLAERVYGEVQDPYALPEDLRIEAEGDIRGAQTARGNYMGNAPSMAEALYKGKIRNDLGTQRISRAGGFLTTPSPVTQSGFVQPIQPDRPAAYTLGGPNAGMQGAQLGQMAFQNATQQYNAQQQQPNYWMEALKIAGTAAASYYSDERLKNGIEDTGRRTRDGIPIIRFRFNGFDQLLEGVSAQVAKLFRPDAVSEHNGYLAVRYDLLGTEMREVD